MKSMKTKQKDGVSRKVDIKVLRSSSDVIILSGSQITPKELNMNNHRWNLWRQNKKMASTPKGLN